MANKVFANDREISCKAGNAKSIAAFPDVCLSPPAPPAGPIPLPYPVTAVSSDTDDGSKHVKISGGPVGLKDQSNYKKCTGDEAATKSFGMSVVTHNIMGKVFFTSWSMDVKIEGQNAVRHLDLVTHNHASKPGSTPPWMNLEKPSKRGEKVHPCKGDRKMQERDCKDYAEDPKGLCAASLPPKKKADPTAHELATKIAADKCLAAMRCTLQPYKPVAKEKKEGHACCKPQTPHHLIEAGAVHGNGRKGPTLKGVSPDYREGKALSVCAEGQTQFSGTHGMMHTYQSAGASRAKVETLEVNGGKPIKALATSYGAAKRNAVEAFKKTFPESRCNPDCIKHQLDWYHKGMGMNDRTRIKAIRTGDFKEQDVVKADQIARDRSKSVKNALCKPGHAL